MDLVQEILIINQTPFSQTFRITLEFRSAMSIWSTVIELDHLKGQITLTLKGGILVYVLFVLLLNLIDKILFTGK